MAIMTEWEAMQALEAALHLHEEVRIVCTKKCGCKLFDLRVVTFKGDGTIAKISQHPHCASASELGVLQEILHAAMTKPIVYMQDA